MTVTPEVFTCAGSCGVAWLTRSCVSTWSISGLVAMSKSTVSDIAPLFAFVEYM